MHTENSRKAMVSFSFDDGREDTYRVAFKIMREYGLVGTIHVTTGWVDGSWSPTNWLTAVNGAMTIEQIKECFKQGFEITSHGDRHVTEFNDLENSLYKLKQWGVADSEFLGFSSPCSKLTRENQAEMAEIFKHNNIKYVRSGRSLRCYQFPMKIVYLLQALTGSELLFRIFNDPNRIKLALQDPFFLQSSIIKSRNSAKQVIRWLQKSIDTGSWNIVMFHSILSSSDPGYGRDTWYWDVDKFRALCQWLSTKVEKDISVVTIKEGLRRCREREEDRRE